MDTDIPCSRAKFTVAKTSATSALHAISRGCRSIIAFYPADRVVIRISWLDERSVQAGSEI
jgi:hypothetical protein